MRQNGFLSERDYALACQAPLTVAKSAAQSVEAPYFVDLVNDELQARIQDTDFQSNAFRIYTTLDMHLQRAAGKPSGSGCRTWTSRFATSAGSGARRLPRRRWRWWPSMRTPAK